MTVPLWLSLAFLAAIVLGVALVVRHELRHDARAREHRANEARLRGRRLL